MSAWKNSSLQRFLLRVCVPVLLVAAGFCVWSARAQEPGTGDRLYVVCHVDVAPGPSAASGTKMLQQYVADTRKDKGAMRIEAYVQVDRTNHFSLVEVWQDRGSFEAHENAAHTRQFRQDIQPLLGSPFDERLHHLLE
ncbi:MAG: putative quinol monooxygenase [Bryobacteraceae bacterium]